MIITDLDKYKDHNDKFESLYTFIVHNTTKDEFTKFVYNLLDKVNTIKDNIKKKYLNDRLYSLILYTNSMKNDFINSIILLGNSIDEIELSRKHIFTLNDYNIQNINVSNDRQYNIKFLKDLFFDFDFYDVINIKNKEVQHLKINTTKSKIISHGNIDKFELDEYITKNITKECLFHGVSSVLKTLKKYNLVFNKHLTNEEIFKIFTDNEMKKLHMQLNDLLGYLPNENKSHLVKYGKDIIKNDYNVKTLFCIHDKYDKVKSYFDEKSLSPNIISIKSLESNDVYYTLRDDFSGFIAEMYY